MRALKATIPLLALTFACQMPEPPGELVGEYAITGTLLDNTCGDAALPVADVLSYRVQLRREGPTAYWLIGAPPANQGTITASGAIRFEREERFMVGAEAQPVDPVLAELDPLALYGYDPFDPTADPLDAQAPCTLIVREAIDAQVLSGVRFEGADDDNPALAGENEIAMRATSDSQCQRVLATSGGPFEQLPCAATYELSGELLAIEDE